jgi:aryl-alcohol dehydrogenase-like predicted oxidoreductase
MEYGIANRAGRPSPQQAEELIAEAWSQGIRVFDTAAAYGDSESVLGAGLRRCGVQAEALVVTKVSPRLDPQDEEGVKRSVEESCRRLGTERLWGVLLHREEWLDCWDGGVGRALRGLRDHGRVSHLGVSVYSAEAAQRALRIAEVDLVQVPCSAWDQRMSEAGVLAAARSGDKLCMVRSIYLQGLLTMPVDLVQERLPRARKAAGVWRRMAESRGVAPVQLAMRFALSLGLPLVVGAESREQLLHNVRLLEEPSLDAEECALIRRSLTGVLSAEIVNPSQWRLGGESQSEGGRRGR